VCPNQHERGILYQYKYSICREEYILAVVKLFITYLVNIWMRLSVLKTLWGNWGKQPNSRGFSYEVLSNEALSCEVFGHKNMNCEILTRDILSREVFSHEVFSRDVLSNEIISREVPFARLSVVRFRVLFQQVLCREVFSRELLSCESLTRSTSDDHYTATPDLSGFDHHLLRIFSHSLALQMTFWAKSYFWRRNFLLVT
jgi:hypothetical protein